MDACPHKHLLVNISRALYNTEALVKGAKDGDNVHKNVCRMCSIETMEYAPTIKRTNTIQPSKGWQYGGDTPSHGSTMLSARSQPQKTHVIQFQS